MLHKGLDELLDNPGDFKTFVVDSMSDIYDSIIAEREAYLRKKTNNIAYELQPRDYTFIKKQVKLLITKILALDMNIIVTARAKDLYSEKEFMQKIGVTADGHKEMPYKFDVVLELQKDAEGKRWAVVEKDRTNCLPHTFEFNYETFSTYLDVDGLKRKAVAFDQRKAIDDARGRTHEITMPDGTVRKTAGIEVETITELQSSLKGRSSEELVSILRDEFSVESVMDLTDAEGKSLIKYIKSLSN